MQFAREDFKASKYVCLLSANIQLRIFEDAESFDSRHHPHGQLLETYRVLDVPFNVRTAGL